MKSTKHHLSWLLAVVGFLVLSSHAAAQLSNLDKGVLIDGLRREGMGDLLIHLAQTEQFDDPKAPRQIVVAQKLLEFRNKLKLSSDLGDQASQTADLAQRQALEERSTQALAGSRQDLRDALAEQQKLINDFRDDPMRPVWQTDLAELLLLDYLAVANSSAAEFYEFGVTTREQKTAFEDAITQAYEQLIDADQAFFNLQGSLPNRPDFREKFDSTGVFELLINRYWRLRTQYFLAQAAYYLSLVPDEHTYYKTLGKNAVVPVPRQARTPRDERAKLLETASKALESFINDQADTHGLRLNSMALAGRIRLKQGKLDEGIRFMNAVVDARRADIVDLNAQMGLAIAHDLDGDDSEADDLVNALARHTVVGGNLLYRLLVADLDHRLSLHRAEKATGDRRAAIERAYEPYIDLLRDPSMGPAMAAAVENYVANRWEANLDANQRLEELPSVVLMLVGKVACTQGQNLSVSASNITRAAQQMLTDAAARGASQQEMDELEVEAQKIAAEGDEDLAKAQAPLKRAIDVLDVLLKRESLDPHVRSEAMYYKGLSVYFQNPFDDENIIKAANLFTDLADQLPDQRRANQAISTAVLEMLFTLHTRRPRPMGVDEPFERAVNVLFAKFGESPAADNVRLYYASQVLMATGRHADAVEALNKVPPTHPSYFEAQRELLYARLEMYRRSEGVVKQELANKIIEEGQNLQRAAERDLPGADGQQEFIIRNADAHARLVVAEVAAETGQGALASKQLEDFEERFSDMPELINDAVGRQIMALVAARDFTGAVTIAQRMMAEHPDKAADVVDSVLRRTVNRIDTLRRMINEERVERVKQEHQQEVEQLAQGAVQLGRLLLDWAQKQPVETLYAMWQFDPQENPEFAQYLQDRVPWQLPLLKALPLAGRAQEATTMLAVLLEKYPADADLLLMLGDTYFALGDRESLILAATKSYDMLIQSLEHVDGAAEPDLKRVYWHAWMRRLQISDILNAGVGDISLRVKQLQSVDANLGGEPFRSELERLANKHAGAAR